MTAEQEQAAATEKARRVAAEEARLAEETRRAAAALAAGHQPRALPRLPASSSEDDIEAPAQSSGMKSVGSKMLKEEKRVRVKIVTPTFRGSEDDWST